MGLNEVKFTRCNDGEYQEDRHKQGFGLYQNIGRRDLKQCRSKQEDTAYWALLKPDLLSMLSPVQISQRLWSCYQLFDSYCRKKLHGGTTAITTVYDGKGTLITANVGDSVAFVVIYKKDGTLAAVERLNTVLHSPSLRTERGRINRAGGILECQEVPHEAPQYFLPSTNSSYRGYNILALSRAIGDAEFQGTTAEACINIISLQKLYQKQGINPDEVGAIQIISASDGLTEPAKTLSKSNQEQWLRHYLTQIEKPKTEAELATLLAAWAMNQESTDNITVAVQTLSESQIFIQSIFDGHVNNNVSRYVAEHMGRTFREQCQLPQEEYAKQACSVNKHPVTYWRDNKHQDPSFSIQTYEPDILLRKQNLSLIREQIMHIQKKAWEYNSRWSLFLSLKDKNRASCAAAMKLYEFLNALANKYEDYELTGAEFIACAHYVLSDKKPVVPLTDNTAWGFANVCVENARLCAQTLRQHRGWKQFIVNLLVACSSLFIGYGIAALSLGRFALFRPSTDGGNLLDKLDHHISLESVKN